MKLFSQLVTIVGILISGFYSYLNDYSFEGVVAFISFLAAFSATFFFGNSSKMNQQVGDNSKAYQSGRDINIKE
ncbi:hypothetical protein ETN89_17695 [Photobacterium damselae subsp. damselae]|uniref:hypothetical protein n=1 Tax=Photobacterium damselae TaxID=38293 RepID=UPI000A2FCCB0|nr:hypothetical protein [Photobacterium damselae]ARR51129.1 hypothetical protein CAY62_16850 [Photobacterium damselae subsp. damselae]AWK83501.1 hypothetical protein BST98_15815 [Photobacterium damselae]QAY37086.1 hypothetical protein ETN89_17695 [Photobacterium damselae subsp. damselae]